MRLLSSTVMMRRGHASHEIALQGVCSKWHHSSAMIDPTQCTRAVAAYCRSIAGCIRRRKYSAETSALASNSQCRDHAHNQLVGICDNARQFSTATDFICRVFFSGATLACAMAIARRSRSRTFHAESRAYHDCYSLNPQLNMRSLQKMQLRLPWRDRRVYRNADAFQEYLTNESHN